MSGNSFAKFVNAGAAAVPGESQQDGHLGKDGWFEITSWTWAAGASIGPMTSSAGASMGRPQAQALSFSHYYDKASGVVMKNLAAGTHFDSLTIDMCKSTGGDKPEVYFQLVAGKAYITSVSNSADSSGQLTQVIELVSKEIAIAYKPQKKNGALDAAVLFNWNIATSDAETATKTTI